MRRTSLILLTFSCALAALGTTGCDGDATLTLDADSIRLSTAVRAQGACNDDEAPTAGLPCGANRMRLCARVLSEETPDGIQVVCSDDVDLGAAPDAIDLKVPPGDEVLVTLQAWDAATPNAVRWCGRTLLRGVFEKAQVDIDIFPTLCSDFTVARSGTESLGPRAFHTATAVENNLVLIAGGVPSIEALGSCGPQTGKCRATGRALQTAVVYDAGTGEVVRRFPLIFPRAFHSATSLPGGRVLLAGGVARAQLRYDGDGPILFPADFGDAGDTVEVVDPIAGTSQLITRGTGEALRLPGGPRGMHSAVLGDREGSRVLLVGGVGRRDPASAESDLVELTSVVRFDATAGNDNSIGLFQGQLTEGRAGMVGVPVGDPPTLVAVWGGFGDAGAGGPADIEFFDITQNTFRVLPRADGSAGAWPATWGAAAGLLEGGALVSGGFPLIEQEGIAAFQPTAEAYVARPPETAVDVRLAGTMATPRAFHAAARLLDGRVLVAGGVSETTADGHTVIGTAEIWTASTSAFAVAPGNGALRRPRGGLKASVLEGGTVLLSGGFPSMSGAGRLEATGELEIFNPATTQLCGEDPETAECLAFFGPAVDTVRGGASVSP